MPPTPVPRRLGVALGLGLSAALALSACGGDDGGSDEGGEVSLSFLVDNAETTVLSAEGVIAAFEEANPGITVELETRPQGGEGDNIVKTRLATGDMTDVFAYNSGSLLAALSPEQSLVPVTDEEWVGALEDSFVQSVSVGDQVYGAPVGTSMGGGVLYHKPSYDELGLEVPTTWDEFMDNNEQIAAAGRTAVIQTYGADSTWTSQLFVLGDFANVLVENPDWAEQYTANEIKYAEDSAALRGFEHLQEVNEAGVVNDDFASATYAEGTAMLAQGEGVHYPMLTFALSEIAAAFPEQAQDIGFFALPGDDAGANPATVWSAGGIYLPQSTDEAKRDAALEFMAFYASPDGCEAQTEAVAPNGPYPVEGCDLPDDALPAVLDIQAYFDTDGGTGPALEFLSPVKGPALEQITVEVGSGIRSAEDGAALYDQDVEKQAQQLGLEGW